MSEIIYLVNKPFVNKWISDRLPGPSQLPLKAPSYGIMIDGELRAGIIFEGITKTNAYMHIVTNGKKNWLTKKLLHLCFDFPFNYLKVNRVTSMIRAENLESQRFNEHLGFVYEGCIRKAAFDGTDLVVYGMTREDCRWIR